MKYPANALDENPEDLPSPSVQSSPKRIIEVKTDSDHPVMTVQAVMIPVTLKRMILPKSNPSKSN